MRRHRRFLALVVITGPLIAEEADEGFKHLSLQELMEVDVTTVSRQQEPLAQAASSIVVVTADDIRRSGATSLPETLRLAPNLEVAQIDARQWQVSARGFNGVYSDKLLAMIDGRSIYTPLYAGVFWDVQEVFLPDVERIEVVSGPGATLWGSNAVNGVINVVSKSADQTQGVALTGAAGNEVHGYAGARYGGAIGDDLFFRVYAQYRAVDDSIGPDGGGGDDANALGQSGMRMDWKPSSGTTVTLQGDVYDGAIDQPSTASDIGVSGGNLLGRWTQQLGEGSDLQLQAYADRTDRRIPTVFGERLDTYDLDFQHRFPIGERNKAIWGLGYRVMVDRVDNAVPLAFYPDDVTHDLVSAFAQDEIALIKDHLALTLGTKFERNDYTGWETQPSARLAWRPLAEHTIWASASRAVRSPSRIDRDYYVPAAPPYVVQGGSDFRSEKLWAYELGYRVRPDELLALSTTLFFHDYDDSRSVQQVAPPAPAPVEVANGFRARSYGAELSADYRPAPWLRLRGGWTELRVTFDRKPGSTDTTGGSAEADDPEHQLSLATQLDLPRGWQADLRYRFVSRLEHQQVPSYSELDARIAWLPRESLELSLVGRNLIHDRHAEWGQPADRHEIERSVYGMLLWRF